ncbi:fumarylacetoacetate hydrolase family protein [bacterium]|nr:fumarylacetoacetate hydrolase family protein [bacterium]
MKVFRLKTGNEMKIGVMLDDAVIDFQRARLAYELADRKATQIALICQSMDMMIKQGIFKLGIFTEVCDFLKKHNLVDSFTVKENFKYEIPLIQPSKILALGRNYRAHAEESNLSVPDEPIIFDKVTSSMLPHEGEIVYPSVVNRLDHEIELVIIIGKTAKDISPSDAYDHIAGYTIGNDISARDMQERDMKIVNPWLRSKSFDTFTPLGPFVVPKDAVDDAQNLEMELKVNGETRQKSTTAKMVFDIPSLMSYISKHMTLLPGDMIMTGTPEGISALEVGDVVEATIEGIGTLRNTVVSGG